ncbi:metallophosphoesterase family protein [uncultured Clostridium sp.]|jgi:putative phosphoesterase|uniref:metallophosphoesterase family protein n=1 Tax=uncultured Clostridium sp. TaxID=59620 RepID=UPI00261DD430|nr:metallophosphoesterase family protein [uncultured Clostridium sp.]
MRIAVISDIHGNLYSLLRVLEDIDSQDADTIICLGDLVGYGPHPNEVIALIKKRNILCLKGNYDASVVDNDFTFIRRTNSNEFSLPWTVEELRASNSYYLNSLPTELTMNICDKKIKFVHGSPRKIDEYMDKNNLDKETIMSELTEDILVCAHTHIPSVEQFGDKMLINDGSIGKPKNGSSEATYILLDLYDGATPKVKVRKVEYDLTKITKDMQMKKFPSSLITSYQTGRE